MNNSTKRKTSEHFEKTMLQDRNGVYFIGGCRVRDVYSGKYGTVEGISTNHIAPHLTVWFDNHDKAKDVRPIMLEITSGGLREEVINLAS